MDDKPNQTPITPFFDPGLAWEYYTNLENNFIEYLKYVPLEKDHYNVWSPVLGNLLNNTGSVIDSFLKTAIFSEIFNDTKNIAEYRKRYSGKKKLDMKVYRPVFEEKYNLSKKKIFELKTNTAISPFFAWGEEQTSLDWWNGYTNFKHDQFAKKHTATLKITLDALGGLFLLNVIHLETRSILFRDGFIDSVNPFFSDSILHNILEIEPLKGDLKIRAKTRLFGYIFENEAKEILDHEKIALLSPWITKTHRNISPRMKNSHNHNF